jgi:hypothetical protein
VASTVSRFRYWIKGLADTLCPPQRIEMIVQTDRLLIIRRRSRRVWCQQCGHEVDAVTFPQAGTLAGGAQPVLPGNTRSEAWHVCTGEEDEQLVCLASLLNSIGDGEI